MQYHFPEGLNGPLKIQPQNLPQHGILLTLFSIILLTRDPFKFDEGKEQDYLYSGASNQILFLQYFKDLNSILHDECLVYTEGIARHILLWCVAPLKH